MPTQQDHEFDVGADKVEIQLTDFVVLYKPRENEGECAQANISLLTLKVKDQKWSLRLTSSSLNHWEAKDSPLIIISKETGSLNISLLQGERSDDVAITFVTWKELVGGTEGASHSGGRTGGTELISLTDREGSWRIQWTVERRYPERARDNDLVTRWKRLEALFPGEGWVNRLPDDPAAAASAIADFHREDLKSYGSDIIRQQGQVMAVKGKGKYGGILADIEEAIEVQTLLVIDPRVQECRQMHAITTSYLGAIYHECFNQTVAVEDLDHAISLYRAAVERSSPQFGIHADCLHRLAEGYYARYQIASDDNDCGRAITALSKACDSQEQDPSLVKYRVGVLIPWLKEHLEHGKSMDPLNEAAIPCLLRVLATVQDNPNHPLFPTVEDLGKLLSRFMDDVEARKRKFSSNLDHAATLSADLFCINAEAPQVVKETVEDHSISSSLNFAPPPNIPAIEGVVHTDPSSPLVSETKKKDIEAPPSPQITLEPSTQKLQEASPTHCLENQPKDLEAQQVINQRRIVHLEQEVADLRSLLQKSLIVQAAPVTIADERPRPSPSLSLMSLPGFSMSTIHWIASSKLKHFAFGLPLVYFLLRR
ncbi:hypothetical protein BKA70DRAFT_1565863, partial [Coprinopsis sp. MPI-PUGE-AT-0042]